MIKKPKPSDINQIAELHMISLKDGLLYQLGKETLKKVYQEILQDKKSFIFVHYNKKKIIGAAASSLDEEELFGKVKKKYFLSIGLRVLARSITMPSLPFKILKSKYSSATKPELLFLFVDPKYRGGGIGKKLVDKTTEQFRKMGVNKYKITILASNKKGKKFYEKAGFKKTSSMDFMGQKRDIYVHKLSMSTKN